MVYFDDWDSFKKAAEELYMASPLKVNNILQLFYKYWGINI